MPNDLPDWTSAAVSSEQAIPGSPFTFARDGLGHDVNGVQVPIGCKAIAAVTAVSSDIALWTVTGTTTGTQYESIVLQGFSKVLYCRVHQQVDATVNLHFAISSGAGNAIVGVVFLFSDTVVSLDALVENPVFLMDGGGNVLAADTAQSGLRRLGVSLALSDPAPWQQANVNGFFAQGTIASGGTLTVIPAGGAQVNTYLQKVKGTVAGAAGSTLNVECPAGTIRSVIDCTFTHLIDLDFMGLACGLNTAVVLHNGSASATAAINGNITALQR